MQFRYLMAAGALAFLSGGAAAQTPASGLAPAATYADLADLADAAQLVIKAQIRDQAEVSAERAPGLAPGFARLYIEARTLALVSGSVPVGENLRYIVDVPRDARGKAPRYKKQEVLLFAKPVPGRAGEIQLVGPAGQMPYTPATEARLRPILSELVAPDAAPAITGVRDALSVPGNLTGESETQIFLSTAEDGPVSITVARRPGMRPVWGVSWSEIVDQSARAPARDTLSWYRLACSLPAKLPGEANLSRDPAERALAAQDYALVVDALGPCERNLGGNSR